MFSIIALAIDTTPRYGLQSLLVESPGTLKIMSYAGALRSYWDTHIHARACACVYTQTYTHMGCSYFSPQTKR